MPHGKRSKPISKVDTGSNRRPSIFNYLDPIQFLKDLLSFFQEQGVSAREVQRQAKLKSSSFLSMILSRERNLTPDIAEKLGNALKLPAAERKLFRLMAELQGADHSPDGDMRRQEILDQVLQIKRQRNIFEPSLEQFEAFTRASSVTLMAALGTSFSHKNLGEMAKDLNLSQSEIKDQLHRLEQLGMIERVDNTWVRTKQMIETPAYLKDLVTKRYHQEMIERGLEAMHTLPGTDRSVFGMTVPLSKKQFNRVSEKAWEFLKELNAAMSDDEAPEGIYQISLLLFPLLDITKPKK